ncbi:hypothetical protein MHZ92_07990 [Sporosarcina sp. ACRSL]|uniref:hypothetical protein n=1 Tax=Sporosarcina sp. ACRSL TaxID=2918215 RepID=UPI001EF4ED1F|nr:hypothetical protein [Sporosarcina sp. ACRSL]MCG7344068.1 hypothetical protein [Sporosarcina sp. ACRSL]
MNFEECLQKHFPLGYQMHRLLSSESVEESSLSLLQGYSGNYELEEMMLGALILHVQLGNIKGYDVDDLLSQLNWSPDFEYDVKKYFRESNMATNENFYIERDNEIGKYDFDGNGNVLIDGGYDRYGYNRNGYDEEGYSDLGYQEED